MAKWKGVAQRLVINEFAHYSILVLIVAMNEAILPDTDPRATTGLDQVTTAVVNSGCFSCCLAIFFMISLATESVSHPSCTVLLVQTCLDKTDRQTDRQTDGPTLLLTHH